jgi:hypothetical protein
VSNVPGSEADEPRTHTFIVAGTARHAELVAFSKRLPRGRWTYVHDAYQLNGIGRGHTILVYETWHSLPAEKYEHIRQLVKRAEQVHGAIVERIYESDIR